MHHFLNHRPLNFSACYPEIIRHVLGIYCLYVFCFYTTYVYSSLLQCLSLHLHRVCHSRVGLQNNITRKQYTLQYFHLHILHHNHAHDQIEEVRTQSRSLIEPDDDGELLGHAHTGPHINFFAFILLTWPPDLRLLQS